MSSRIERALQGALTPDSAALETQFRKFTYEPMRWQNDAAKTTTVAVAEHCMGSVKMPMRLVEAKYLPDAASTSSSGHWLTLLVAARLAATPFTSRNLITYATGDGVSTNDLVAFDEEELMTYASATLSALDVAEGEIITVAVTKSGTDGASFPAGTLELRFRPRDT
jgi:hypothetical protein